MNEATESYTRKDFAVQLAKSLDLTGLQAQKAVDAMLTLLSEALVAGKKVEFRDFGVLRPQLTGPRIGRNPRQTTGGPLPYPSPAHRSFSRRQGSF